ncbi:PREDICTED: zinc finger protein 546-like [Papilio xuthus]|uniref:Zinc finger protein 546-like n=1 Tax=Papilio xuthus TaxID=66420 RepID=A0AAJ6Z2Z1_PAPXU|nr:PREDICTED: zinc finger protein 546-like [Papilio xuthus]
METNAETFIFLARCKCCLNEGELQNLWEPYLFDGETEIYGEMLSECFSLSPQADEHLQSIEMICNSCIKRLRDALSFRREVIASIQVLKEHQDKMFLHTIAKEEEVETEKESEYQSIEYLDFTEGSKEQSSDDDNIINDESQNLNKKTTKDVTKWPKKLPKEFRNKTYKQYSVSALKMAIDAVLSERMTIAQASVTYGVPRKTVTAKIHAARNKKEDKDDEPNKFYEQEKHNKLVEEIKIILTYTNAVPYKSKASRYYCIYCSDSPGFEDGQDLRTHTRTKHIAERTSGIDQIMRPPWLNEVIKLDIHCLHCTICLTSITNWNDMFRHLEEQHEIVLDEAYTKVIPFILNSELNCALCSESFSSYHYLDGHMNSHYSNYICYECGDIFLAASRLNRHIETHQLGEYPCPACGKIFKSNKYMRKHYDYIHNTEKKIKCYYCPERFFGTYERHQHNLKMHKERVKIMTCEVCGKTFDWLPYYTSHMRRIHGTEKNYECKDCGKMFLMKYELNNHRIKHKTEKNFVCDVCSKQFKSKPGLLKHYQISHG